MTFDVNELIKWVVVSATALLGWLYRGHENRILSLESTRVSKADADEQRQALRDDVKEFRQTIERSLETLRTETNFKLEKLSDQVSHLSRNQ